MWVDAVGRHAMNNGLGGRNGGNKGSANQIDTSRNNGACLGPEVQLMLVVGQSSIRTNITNS